MVDCPGCHLICCETETKREKKKKRARFVQERFTPGESWVAHKGKWHQTKPFLTYQPKPELRVLA